jgi:deoxycytidylate deaminase
VSAIPEGLIPLLLRDMARQSTCLRSRVGAVAVDRYGRVVGTGWNLEREGRCDWGQCPRGLLSVEEQPRGTGYAGQCVADHAEVVALRMARGRCHTIFVTREPCEDCSRLIREIEVRVVYWADRPG